MQNEGNIHIRTETNEIEKKFAIKIKVMPRDELEKTNKIINSYEKKRKGTNFCSRNEKKLSLESLQIFKR